MSLPNVENKRKLKSEWFVKLEIPANTNFKITQMTETSMESIRGAIISFESSAGGSSNPIARYVYVGKAPTADTGLPIHKWDRLNFTSSEIRDTKFFAIVAMTIQMQLRDVIYSQ